MNNKPKKRLKKMTIFIGVIALLLGLLIVGDLIWRQLYPMQPEVVDLCNTADKTSSAQTSKQCRWVIPAKYVSMRLAQSGGRYFEARVSMADIDSAYPVEAKYKVTFQFWPNNSWYADRIRWKKETKDTSSSDEQGLHWFRERETIFFEGFDGVEVQVSSAPTFSSIQSVGRIYRPLSPNGSMHWIVHFPPSLASQEAMDSYVQHNIHDIDRKLMQFISQWH
jgi:hypothetical protein